MAPRTRMTPDQVAASREARRQAWEEKTGLTLHERGTVTREVRAANVVGLFFQRLWPQGEKDGD